MPIDHRAITKARSRLRVAKKAVEELASCRDFDVFTDLWYQFLTAAKNIYVMRKTGAKTDEKARQWFGAKEEYRRRDELLQYIFQARNDDEHGIEPVAEHVHGSVQIGAPGDGFSKHVWISHLSIQDGTLAIGEMKGLDGKPVLTKITPPHARLIVVKDQYGGTYNPPTMHLGNALKDNSPLTVAQLGVAYLDSLLLEAERLP